MNSCSLLHLIYDETGSNIPENNGTVLCTREVEQTKKKTELAGGRMD